MDLVGDISWKLLFVLCISGLHSGEAGKRLDSKASDEHQNPSKLKKGIRLKHFIKMCN
jgi:hypothetical protein